MAFFGLQKTTLIDFPGIVAATVFIPGCNLRCPYCHNPELVMEINPDTLYTYEQIIGFLEKRHNVLQGVCLSGGEPLLYEELTDLINIIHSLGLKVKIDTNGTIPEKLSLLSADYIAMDIKTRPAKYHLVCKQNIKHIATKIKNSIRWIISSGIPHEFRTTIAPGIVDKEDIHEICTHLKGTRKYVLSQFRPSHTLDPAYEQFPPTDLETLEELQRIVNDSGIPCRIRYSNTQKISEKNL